MQTDHDRDVNVKVAGVAPKFTDMQEAAGLDLPRFCLELDPAESKRALAWVNAICLTFLIIGLIGLKPPPIAIVRRAAPQEEAAPVVIEPLVAAVQTVSETSPEQMAEAAPSEGPGVAVTLDSPAVAFSVPTVGNVLVPLGLAQAPPANPMQAAAPISSPHIEQTTVTGVGGSRPPPFYPLESQRLGEQGSVTLLMEVNAAGRVTSVRVTKSSGYARLDRAASEHVRKTWFFGSGAGTRMYECTIDFQLR